MHAMPGNSNIMSTATNPNSLKSVIRHAHWWKPAQLEFAGCKSWNTRALLDCLRGTCAVTHGFSSAYLH